MKYFYLIILAFGFFAFVSTPKQRVFMIGDSTMANKKTTDAPETGWGQVFPLIFNEGIEFHNYAVNGRSTKSFREKGHWKEVLEQLRKDDYVIIQFGHNDAKKEDPERYAEATTDYKNNLIQYITEIKEKGAIPILCTPVNRRKFNEKGEFVDTHGKYPSVVKEVAQQQNVELLDIQEGSRKLIIEHGEELSKSMFMHLNPNTFPKYPNGLKDDTHFTPYGAKLIAAKVADLLVKQKHPLRTYLKTSPFTNKFAYELPLVIEPVFKNDTFEITKYGAKTGINSLNTKSIQDAIDNASNLGGGTVSVPSGLWITGPLVLKSNVNLHLEKGAVLQFSDDRNQYPIIETTWEGQKAYRCQAPISAFNQTNIALTGQGTIDGAGQVWKAVKKSKLTESQWIALLKTGGVTDGTTWYPSASSKLGHEYLSWASKIVEGKTMQDYESVRDYLRPNMVSLNNCTRIKIDGLTFLNSPAWTLHPLLCQHITVANTNVINPWFGQNNDAIDLESCKNGILDNCLFDTGDDAITIKSGKDEEGRKRGVPTENFIISNTKVLHGHGGFVIGSEMSGGVRNMFVHDCSFMGTDIGLRFKTTRGRGGSVNNIYVANISMSKIVGEAVLFDMYYAAKDPIVLAGEEGHKRNTQLLPVTEGTPEFKDFYLENISCNNANTAILVNGLPEKNIQHINIKNSSFKSQKGIEINDADTFNFENVEVNNSEGNWIKLHDAKNIIFNNVFGNKTQNKISISGETSSKIQFMNMKEKPKSSDIEISKEVNNQTIKY